MEMNMHEAKTKLSQLVRAAQAGEHVVISQAGKPAVKLVPVKKEKKKSEKNTFRLGQFKGELWYAEDAFDPLPDEFWLGHENDPLKS